MSLCVLSAGADARQAAQADDSAIEDDMDLDSWLGDTDTQTLDSAQTDALRAATADEAAPDEGPPPPKKKKWKKKDQDEVVGVFKKRKITSVNPREAAASKLKDFFEKRR